MNLIRKSSLSPQQRWLIEDVLREHPFSQIHQLHVSKSEPLSVPAPILTCNKKLGAEPHQPVPAESDFWLKRQVIELLDAIKELGEGVIEKIEVRHGLPWTVKTVRPAVAARSKS